MTKQLSEYEIDKQNKKQRLVRNEFLYYSNSVGKYDMPLIKRQSVDVDKIKFLSYVDAKKTTGKTKIRRFIFLLMTGSLKTFIKMRVNV